MNRVPNVVRGIWSTGVGTAEGRGGIAVAITPNAITRVETPTSYHVTFK